MYRLSATLLSVALLTSCVSKKQKILIDNYNKEIAHHKKLLKTEKAQLYNGQLTKAVLTATYLNEKTLDIHDASDERFMIGIYVEPAESIDTNDTNTTEDANSTCIPKESNSTIMDGYKITLNGKAPKSIQKLQENDPRLKSIPFTSDWSQFYLITFPHKSGDRLKLIFESDLYGKAELKFAKVAKYTFEKKTIF